MAVEGYPTDIRHFRKITVDFRPCQQNGTTQNPRDSPFSSSKIFRQVEQTLGVEDEALYLCLDYVLLICQWMVEESRNLLDMTGKNTLTSREVRFSEL